MGNCIEFGDGLPPGTSYVDLATTTLSQRVPQTDVRVNRVFLQDWSLLQPAIDDCVSVGTDVVVIGAGTLPVLSSRSYHRLEGPMYGTFSHARRVAKAIERRVSNEPSLLRIFGSVRKVEQSLLVKQAPMTVREYLRILEAAVVRLRGAHCRVIVRGPTGVETLTEGKDGLGLASAVARICDRMEVPCVIGEELIARRPDSMVLGYAGRLNEVGQSTLADAFVTLLEREVIGALSGPMRALALPRPRPSALVI